MSKKTKFTIISLIMFGALIAGFIYINDPDPNTKKAAATYFLGILLALGGYIILGLKKK